MLIKSSKGKYKIPDLKLLGTGNLKLMKGRDTNYIAVGLSLAPNFTSSYSLCSMATLGCIKSCLFRSGMSRIFKHINEARIRKAKLFIEDRVTFWHYLIKDIQTAERRIINRGNEICIRLNVVSDIRWEELSLWYNGVRYSNIMELFPNIQFYDYTKIPDRILPPNYYLTFSRSETNEKECIKQLNKGRNVSVVFKYEIPDSYLKSQVINGDNSDLRFLDPSPVIVGLKAKAIAKKDETGFVVWELIT